MGPLIVASPSEKLPDMLRNRDTLGKTIMLMTVLGPCRGLELLDANSDPTAPQSHYNCFTDLHSKPIG